MYACASASGEPRVPILTVATSTAVAEADTRTTASRYRRGRSLRGAGAHPPSALLEHRLPLRGQLMHECVHAKGKGASSGDVMSCCTVT